MLSTGLKARPYLATAPPPLNGQHLAALVSEIGCASTPAKSPIVGMIPPHSRCGPLSLNGEHRPGFQAGGRAMAELRNPPGPASGRHGSITESRTPVATRNELEIEPGVSPLKHSWSLPQTLRMDTEAPWSPGTPRHVPSRSARASVGPAHRCAFRGSPTAATTRAEDACSAVKSGKYLATGGTCSR